MENGDGNDDKLIGGISKHDYTGKMAAGFSANEYGDEIDEGGGSYSISANVAGKSLKTVTDAFEIAKKKWPSKYGNMSIGDYQKEVNAYWKEKKITPQEYSKGRSDKLSFTQKSAKVTNNTNVSKNQNKGNGGVTNIATGGAGGSVGDINIGGGGKTTTPPAGTSTKPKPVTSTKPAAGTSTTTTPGTTSQYSGNNGAANQATGGAGGSVGNITINTGGGSGGGGGTTPGPLADGGGSAIDKLLGRIPKPKATFKKTTGRRNQTTQGGNTPYKFRGLQNQFESWQMNHYDNNDQTT